MLNKLIPAIVILVSMIISPAYAQDAFQLISQSEYLQHLKDIEQKNNTQSKGLFLGGTDTDAPVIKLTTPENLKSVKSPLDMQVVFQAATNATIDLSSFTVNYGWINITERVIQHAVIKNASVSVSKFTVPTGTHTFSISIQDNQGRDSEKDFTIRVVN